MLTIDQECPCGIHRNDCDYHKDSKPKAKVVTLQDPLKMYFRGEIDISEAQRLYAELCNPVIHATITL